MTKPSDSYEKFKQATEALQEARAALRGRRVKYVGMSGSYDGPTGTIRNMVAGGLVVKWDSGDWTGSPTVHPNDVQFVK